MGKRSPAFNVMIKRAWQTNRMDFYFSQLHCTAYLSWVDTRFHDLYRCSFYGFQHVLLNHTSVNMDPLFYRCGFPSCQTTTVFVKDVIALAREPWPGFGLHRNSRSRAFCCRVPANQINCVYSCLPLWGWGCNVLCFFADPARGANKLYKQHRLSRRTQMINKRQMWKRVSKS